MIREMHNEYRVWNYAHMLFVLFSNFSTLESKGNIYGEFFPATYKTLNLEFGKLTSTAKIGVLIPNSKFNLLGLYLENWNPKIAT